MGYIENQKKKLAMQGVVDQQLQQKAMAPQAPMNEPKMPSDQPETQERQGFLSRAGDKIKGFFHGSEGGVDEYGVQKPGKPSGASKFVDYLLPSLFTVAGGAGLPLGLMAGRAMRRNEDTSAQEAYQKKRKSAADIYGEEQKLGLGRDTLGETIRHNKATEGIDRTRAAGEGNPGWARVADDRKAMAIEQKYRSNVDPTPDEKAWLKAYYRLKQTQKLDAPEVDNEDY